MLEAPCDDITSTYQVSEPVTLRTMDTCRNTFVHSFCVKAPRAQHLSCKRLGLCVASSEYQLLPHAQTPGLWLERPT